MSTAGKVLSVLVTLLAAVWVVLAAGVTQLNRNGASAVEKAQQQLVQVEKDVAKVKHDVAALVDEAFNERLRTQNDVTNNWPLKPRRRRPAPRPSSRPRG